MYQNGHNNKSSSSSKPCPKCGGNDRFYRIQQSTVYGNEPGWFCRQCNHSEADASNISPALAPAREALTPEELAAVWTVNEQAVSYTTDTLWSRKGQDALCYLRERGFSDEIIRELRLGYHNPKTTGRNDERDYGFGDVPKDTIAARNAGLLNKFGDFQSVLKNVITIPYIYRGQVVMLRARSLNDCSSAKYLSPAGPLFAGGKPFFYLHDVLNELRARGTLQIALTEGEFKAAAMYAFFTGGRSSISCHWPDRYQLLA